MAQTIWWPSRRNATKPTGRVPTQKVCPTWLATRPTCATSAHSLPAASSTRRTTRLHSRQVYILVGWPHFDATGRLYVPRAYIERRWPAWLGQGQWAPRAALLMLLDRLAVDQTGVSSTPGQPLEVTAYVKELRQHAQVILPAADVAAKVGTGLTMLADLGLITETTRSRFNCGYCLRTDAFERLPVWPLAEDRGPL